MNIDIFFIHILEFVFVDRLLFVIEMYKIRPVVSAPYVYGYMLLIYHSLLNIFIEFVSYFHCLFLH